MGIFLVIITCTYLFIRTKNKMAEILGEQADFDVNDDTLKKAKEYGLLKEAINKVSKYYEEN